MESIWQVMEKMVTPTKGQLSNTLKHFWGEFMERFRKFAIPLDASRALLVVCHILPSHFTRGHAPKEVFQLLLDEKAFSVWTVHTPDDRGILHFEKHSSCRAISGWTDFSMKLNSVPNIALTGIDDWEQAKILLINNYQKIFPGQGNVPFGGSVYPRELVEKTARLERELAQQKQALAAREQAIAERTRQYNELLDENLKYMADAEAQEKLAETIAEKDLRIQALEELARTNAGATSHPMPDPAVQAAQAEAMRLSQALSQKDATISQLESELRNRQQTLTAANAANSSREAALDDATRREMARMQKELDAVNAEKQRLLAENRRVRTMWSGSRASPASLGSSPPSPQPTPPSGASAGGGGAPALPPEILAFLAQQAERQDKLMAQVLQIMTSLPTPVAQPAAPPIITVVSTQTDARRVALQRVHAAL